MTQALVIKQIGDPQVCGAIVEGMTRTIIPLDQTELNAVKLEVARLRAANDIRSYGDSRRFERARRELARKYYTPPMNPVRGAILAVWGMLWLGIYNAYDYLSAWNREP